MILYLLLVWPLVVLPVIVALTVSIFRAGAAADRYSAALLDERERGRALTPEIDDQLAARTDPVWARIARNIQAEADARDAGLPVLADRREARDEWLGGSA